MSYRSTFILLSLFCLSGCSSVAVQAWQKEALASEAMQKDGGNKLHKQFSEHIYYSKESTKGGGGVAGGGCGCN